ncbi:MULTISPECIES: CpsB/CapC family capsule biosynthesis tyrosine phosphatase [Mesotoga]|uniref:CpsB/CapC family capsule biosynthesis tyrosine phosphatase n=1 Tax=Mesotoga TaxID=1184396 RepID=UPI000EF1414F|nr:MULTISPECIES: CpsB/CapC family capsule biosynthesis tyrosine phosphatase [Mesotoga]MCP5456536.1 capsular biosynthesis protein [Thermotogota bacterium]MCP5460497.1 capsular biosynthesis protein [Thermotogota bacterium]MDK2943342.1 protein-tyrosine phosphatase [Mesotoga sp.]RLL88412.1 capsular biosynthesis protein [Mesotoga sp. H07pep.5.4]HNS74808.1 capsular biosynthesis protein [Mesotoga prima]
MNIDSHCHLLPAVDDGVEEIEESLAILEEMKLKGLQRLYLTPHLFSPISPSDPAEIMRRWHEFRFELNNHSVEVLLGSEIFLRPEVLESDLITMGESNFLLVELSTQQKPHYLFEVIGKLQSTGFRIILAHLERYHYLFKKIGFIFGKVEPTDEIHRLRDMGVLFQVNWNSLDKDSKARVLVDRRIADITGSDKHKQGDNRLLIDFDDDRYRLFLNDSFL